jgi:hypothetical protein
MFTEPHTLPDAILQVAKSYRPGDAVQMELLLKGSGAYNTLESEAFIYAPAVRAGRPYLWPVLTFAAAEDSARLKIEAAFFFEEDWSAEEKGEYRVGATGLRFEPPEDEYGVHSYYHAQPITSFGGREDGRLSFARTVNTSFPAVPLAATDSVSLLGAVLVSLYGRTGARSMLGDPQVRTQIELVRSSFEPWILDSSAAR